MLAMSSARTDWAQCASRRVRVDIAQTALHLHAGVFSFGWSRSAQVGGGVGLWCHQCRLQEVFSAEGSAGRSCGLISSFLFFVCCCVALISSHYTFFHGVRLFPTPGCLYHIWWVGNIPHRYFDFFKKQQSEFQYGAQKQCHPSFPNALTRERHFYFKSNLTNIQSIQQRGVCFILKQLFFLCSYRFILGIFIGICGYKATNMMRCSCWNWFFITWITAASWQIMTNVKENKDTVTSNPTVHFNGLWCKLYQYVYYCERQGQSRSAACHCNITPRALWCWDVLTTVNCHPYSTSDPIFLQSAATQCVCVLGSRIYDRTPVRGEAV